MRFCRAMLLAKRFIAGVGGRPPASPPPTAAPSKGGPPAEAPSLSLPDDSLGDIAHGVNRANHLLLADHDLVEKAFELRCHARVDQRRIGLFENPEQRQASLSGDDVLSLGDVRQRRQVLLAVRIAKLLLVAVGSLLLHGLYLHRHIVGIAVDRHASLDDGER